MQLMYRGYESMTCMDAYAPGGKKADAGKMAPSPLRPPVMGTGCATANSNLILGMSGLFTVSETCAGKRLFLLVGTNLAAPNRSLTPNASVSASGVWTRPV